MLFIFDYLPFWLAELDGSLLVNPLFKHHEIIAY
jgi:hypothetical protein